MSDVVGNSEHFLTTVIDGSWQVNDANLSVLQDGQLTVTAVSEDLNCNSAEASNNKTIKDTQASITIRTDGLGDSVINGAEIEHVDLVLTASDIEVGQVVAITVTDSVGQRSR